MPRSKKTTIKPDTSLPQVKEGVVGRMTRDVIELHGQFLKEELISNSEAYSLNGDQVQEVCKLVDAITVKTQDKALRQVVSIFKS
tara:strand:- start:42 stop:296 length:255 start_codon:yes stop_codon:yes gene_type:complete